MYIKLIGTFYNHVLASKFDYSLKWTQSFSEYDFQYSIDYND